MNPFASFCNSSIGRKWIVAVTGLALFGFVVGHLLGNLQVFIGPESINRYGAFLQGTGELLWVARIGLFVMLAAHVYFTIKLRVESRGAKPIRYAVSKHRVASLPARWMVWSGLMVFCFLVFHILHFTTWTIDRGYGDLHDIKGQHDVYRMMVQGFSNPFASAFYILGVGLLAMHLDHGFQSMFQTLGLSSAKLGAVWSKIGRVLSWLIFLGYASMPASVLAGWIKWSAVK